MPVKLSVVNEEEDEDTPSDYLFEDDCVTIGRGEENHLTLSDPKRVVSSEHAMVKKQEGSYHLIDRGSKNFTYVDNERITAQRPYELNDGDVFRIGDFRIEFQTLDTPPQGAGASGETVFDFEFSNPFTEPAEQFVEALDALAEAYEDEAEQRRDDALEEAFEEADAPVGKRETIQKILQSMGLEPEEVFGTGTRHEPAPDRSPEAPSDADETEARPSAPAPDTDEPSTASEDAPDTADLSRSTTPEETSPDETSPEVELRGESEEVDEVLDVLAEAFSMVAGIPWQFRHEFIGQTVMQAPETKFLYDGDGDRIRNHLLDPDISQDEREKRLGYVEEAAEALTVHQVAMLNGYKASVMKGTKSLLERLDPDAHEQAVQEENWLFEYLPALAGSVTLERLRAEWQELDRGEGGVAEKRIFRPAFTKAYLARMTAPRMANDSDSSDSES